MDPYTLITALIVTFFAGLLLYFAERSIERWQKKRREKLDQEVSPRYAKLSVMERWFYTLVYSRGLKNILNKYVMDLEKKLAQAPWSDYYVELFTFPMAQQPIELRVRNRENLDELPFHETVKRFAKSGLVILGDSGSGKSTSLKKVAQQFCNEGKLIPLLIELRNYRQPNSLMTLFAQEIGSRTWLERGLKLQRFVLFLDGLNEIKSDLLPVFESDLYLLNAEYPGNGTVVTCRPANYVNNFPNFIHVKLQPLTKASIEVVLKNALEESEGEDLYRSLIYDERLLGLCENPYMLTMLASIYHKTKRFPVNKAKLIEGFLNVFLLEWEAAKWESSKGEKSTSLIVKHDILSDLAVAMGNEAVTIDYATAERITGRKLIILHQSFGHSYQPQTVLEELRTNGLIRLEHGNLSFMHQSIQEFYTARELSERLENKVIQVSELSQYIDDVRWYDTLIMLSGLLPDATTMITVIKKRNLLLASECIQSALKVDAHIVDAVIVQAVTEFKFGDVPFNYPLIFSLKKIGYKRSNNLPQRIIDDMEHWCQKFASTTPRNLTFVDTDELMKIVIDATNLFMLIDAIWTLGERKEVRAVNPLRNILLDRNSPFRADAARALGKIGDKLATSALLSCIKTDEPLNLRPFIFMALGSIKDASALPILKEYLLDLNNPYRETAAWALLGIADESIGDFLIENLNRGIPYARANFVYLMGQKKIKKGLIPIIELMQVEQSPFVREDIAFALGSYGDPTALPVLIECLKDPDPLVRTRVAEAIGKLGGKDTIPKLEKLLNDPSEFVRESVADAIHELDARITSYDASK